MRQFMIFLMMVVMISRVEAKVRHAMVPTAPVNEVSRDDVPPVKPVAKPLAKPVVNSAVVPPGSEVEFTGMIEVASVKKNEAQKVSVWTSFPVLMDESGTKLLKGTNRMMKLKGTLVQKGGVWVFKVKHFEPATGETE